MATPGLKPFDIDIDPNVVSEYAESVFINMKRREVSCDLHFLS